MTAPDATFVVRRYLSVAHDAFRWKLEGVSEYDLRRPRTRTGTNLLGLAKHLTIVQAEYLGSVFGRPFEAPISVDHDVANDDMYAHATETAEYILNTFDAVCAHALETIDKLDLDAEGYVPWWGEAGNPVSLHQIAVHMIAEFHRHLGQVDILREGLDGAAGYREDVDNLAPLSTAEWTGYHDRLEEIAAKFSADP